MHRRDELDATLAKHFAWTFARPGEMAQLLERVQAAHESDAARVGVVVASSPPIAAERADAVDRSRAKGQAACKLLAAAVADVWGTSDEQARLQAVKRLLAKADRLGVELLEMHRWPLEAVRLLRLFVACAPKLTRRQRERAANVAGLVPVDHPEAAELLVEIARAGDRAMADAFLADEEWVADLGGGSTAGDALAARLADIVDDGPSHASRVIAIELVGRIEGSKSAVPAMRRALSLPCFAVRAHALRVLAGGHTCAVEAPHVVRLLRDLVAHAVPDPFSDDEHEENERIFADATLVALERLKASAALGGALAPSSQDLDDAAEALLDWIDAEHDAVWMDAGWATEALSIALPEAGAAMVDHWLKCARSYDRTKSLSALDRLPDDLARPRLRVASNDPAPSVRDPALQKWRRRFAESGPSDPPELLGASLLAGPRSDRFASRLVVLQGRVAEARQAMARALLAEAPDREALVLLLQFIADDTLSNEPLAPHPRATGSDASGLTSDRPPASDWAVLVATRFGEAGVEGLCAVAARFCEPESFGWMRRLGDLVAAGAIPGNLAGPLRSLAARLVASDDTGVPDDALRVLALIGAPPELLERALALALDDELGSPAARDLILAWPDREVDRRLVSPMALALAERDWGRLQRAASVALGRDAPAARVLAQRVLEVVEEDEGALDAAIECAHRLRASGALDDAWALAALARPWSPVFTVAARVWRKSSVVRPVLEAALTSTARDGASRAEAAMALLWGEPPLSVRDRRLTAVLAGAPPAERAELVHAMCMQGAALTVVAPCLEELLVTTDPVVARALIGVAHWLKSPKGHVVLRAALPRIVDAELRADIEGELGTAGSPYWVER
jgi:hypothetical protein